MGSIRETPESEAPEGVRKQAGQEAAQMTAVFNCNLRKFARSPHHVETEFGKAQIVGIGNVFDERDQLEKQRDDLLEALKELSAMYARTWDCADGNLVMFADNIPRFEAAHQAARDAIAKAEGGEQ